MVSANKITPFLWFNGNAEEAANYYVSVFKDARITDVLRAGDGGPFPAGSAITVSFTLHGQDFVAINGGPDFGFTEAVSFMIHCQSQEEIDYYWDTLVGDGGEESMCGWLKDKYGLSWQVAPDRLLTLLQDPDPARAGRVMQAMLQMRKIDLPALERAADDSPHN